MSIIKSPWVIHYDGSSCNGCDIEVLACLTPMYDIERFGIINTGNPKHADVFLVTGSVNEQNLPVVRQIYDQMPSPKVVVAVGVCASTGGIFRECYNTLGGVDQAIPVDVYVPGCAARPEAIIDGVVKGLGVLAEKQAALSRGITDAHVMGGYLYEGPHDEYGTLIDEEAAAEAVVADADVADGAEAVEAEAAAVEAADAVEAVEAEAAVEADVAEAAAEEPAEAVEAEAVEADVAEAAAEEPADAVEAEAEAVEAADAVEAEAAAVEADADVADGAEADATEAEAAEAAAEKEADEE